MMKKLGITCLVFIATSVAASAQTVSYDVGSAPAFTVTTASTASAQRWEFLGERTVRDRVDHDSIPVTVARGDFRRIKLTVRGSAVRFYRVEVIYGNGAPDLIELRALIPAGGETRVIDLRGGERVIRRVDFWYEAKSIGRRGALVRLFGRN